MPLPLSTQRTSLLIQDLKFTGLHRMLSVDDSEKLTIPLAIYVSKDEPLSEVG